MLETGIGARSIHPQGWVPIETVCDIHRCQLSYRSSIHPQGWVPIETRNIIKRAHWCAIVAFTPKGGCPLKPMGRADVAARAAK